jgi:hemoglobin
MTETDAAASGAPRAPEAAPPPTLYEWAGGLPALERLTGLFYARVPHDPVLAPVFREMAPDHPARVARFLGEVFGGPPAYSQQRGGHATMVRQHLDRRLTEAQRARWVQLMGECADAAGLPADPEFRSAFVAYLEWGTRVAVLNSQPGATADPQAPMPRWGWGEPGGPYRG